MAENLFTLDARLKLLITRFSGASEAAQTFGAMVGNSITTMLPQFAGEAIDSHARAAGLRPEDIDTQYVPCLITSHTDARRIGKAWGADVVFWGEAACPIADPKACRELVRLSLRELARQAKQLPPGTTVNVGSQNQIRAGAGSRVEAGVIIQVPTGGSFKTSMTVVNWRGLETIGSRAVWVQDARAVLDMDFPRLASDRCVALLYFVLGLYAHKSARYGIAARYFERSQEEVYARASDSVELLQIIGKTYHKNGETKRSLAVMQQALSRCQLSDLNCQMLNHTEVGIIFFTLENTEEAFRHIDAAARMASQTGNRLGHTMIKLLAAIALSGSCHLQLGIKKLSEVMTLAKELVNPELQARTLEALGHAYARLHEEQRAVASYELALELFRELRVKDAQASILMATGRLYARSGDRDRATTRCREAQPFIEAATKVRDTEEQARSVAMLASLHAETGDREHAINYYEQALALHRKIGDAPAEAQTLEELGTLYKDAGRPDESERAYNEARRLLERWKNDSWRMRERLADLLLQAGRDREAIEEYRQLAKEHHADRRWRQSGLAFMDAFDLACKRQWVALGLEMIADFLVLFPQEKEFAAMLEGRLFTFAERYEEAAAAYRRLRVLAHDLPIDERRKYTDMANAGLERIIHIDQFRGCKGLVVESITVEPSAEMARPKNVNVGDILLGADDYCFDTVYDYERYLFMHPDRVWIWRPGEANPIAITKKAKPNTSTATVCVSPF